MNFKSINSSIFIIIILHFVGIVGSLSPDTSALTISLTPVNLLISALLLARHTEPYRSAAIFFGIAFSIGMAVEIVGVHTGIPFGQYSYSSVLGPKLLGVPLVIGINWFMLAALTGTIASHISQTLFYKIILGATMMLFLDFFIEIVAIKLEYWTWVGDGIPIENYFAWWFISAFMQYVFIKTIKNSPSKPAIALIISQLAYFTAVILFY
ncbi:MAG: putative membrane protein [Cyclobacteriaceae bacterium]|jgi:putative membrane protein